MFGDAEPTERLTRLEFRGENWAFFSSHQPMSSKVLKVDETTNKTMEDEKIIELNGARASRDIQGWAKGEEGVRKWRRNGQRGMKGAHARREEGVITSFDTTAGQIRYI